MTQPNPAGPATPGREEAPADPEALREAATAAFGRLSGVAHQLADEVGAARRAAAAYLRGRPAGLVAGAALAGLLLGVLLDRS
ncbi:MAG: hypothetical protein R3247_15460 [Rhodothermales bacterium]|nr:hypothetical protein [Rhodothermales bacterium]